MNERSYTITALTPTFLGNATQDAQWRTPPFKALLRHWWRIAMHASGYDDWRRIRAIELPLFGAAGDADERSGRSKVRIRLSQWTAASTNPRFKGQGREMHPVAYLGFGPAKVSGSSDAQSVHRAIDPDNPREASVTLMLAYPDCEGGDKIDLAIALIAAFGTIGSRSRNALGSLLVSPASEASALVAIPPQVLVPLQEGLRQSQPTGIGLGRDGKPLVWTASKVSGKWLDAMRELHAVRKGLRARLGESALLLAAPAVRSKWTSPYGANDRVPNSMRFKVRGRPDGSRVATVFHVPCKPPDGLLKPQDLGRIDAAWDEAIRWLDANRALQRVPSIEAIQP